MCAGQQTNTEVIFLSWGASLTESCCTLGLNIDDGYLGLSGKHSLTSKLCQSISVKNECSSDNQSWGHIGFISNMATAVKCCSAQLTHLSLLTNLTFKESQHRFWLSIFHILSLIVSCFHSAQTILIQQQHDGGGAQMKIKQYEVRCFIFSFCDDTGLSEMLSVLVCQLVSCSRDRLYSPNTLLPVVWVDCRLLASVTVWFLQCQFSLLYFIFFIWASSKLPLNPCWCSQWFWDSLSVGVLLKGAVNPQNLAWSAVYPNRLFGSVAWRYWLDDFCLKCNKTWLHWPPLRCNQKYLL